MGLLSPVPCLCVCGSVSGEGVYWVFRAWL